LQEAAERVARRIDAAVEGIDDPLEVLIRLGEANVPDTPEGRALDELDLHRYCCRAKILTNTDLNEKV
jgi:DNA-directed RNA polymerase subunit N (RpoN/RPB10)